MSYTASAPAGSSTGKRFARASKNFYKDEGLDVELVPLRPRRTDEQSDFRAIRRSSGAAPTKTSFVSKKVRRCGSSPGSRAGPPIWLYATKDITSMAHVARQDDRGRFLEVWEYAGIADGDGRCRDLPTPSTRSQLDRRHVEALRGDAQKGEASARAALPADERARTRAAGVSLLASLPDLYPQLLILVDAAQHRIRESQPLRRS